ncbi:MAG TPA: hypothetical protein VK459_17455 [Polyangiaceae bacterium]|nr:hypothetical protein [Polyangiaceae bacterium]
MAPFASGRGRARAALSAGLFAALLGAGGVALGQPAPDPAQAAQPGAAQPGAAQPGAAQPGASQAPAASPPGSAAPTPVTTPAPPPQAIPAAAQAGAPRVHHAPPSVAKPHEPLTIEVLIDYPQLVRYAGVVYKPASGQPKAVPFQRGADARYIAVIPADDVSAPEVSYTIEIERVDGTREAMFATRADMHVVQVIEDRMDARERLLFERLGKRRSVATARGEFVQFGLTTGRSSICPQGLPDCADEDREKPSVAEEFWRVELQYTYRPLRSVAEFSLRGGVVRGKSLVGNTLDANQYKVGLNYGAPSVRFRLDDAWHVEAEFLTSITEDGFAVGLGSSLIIGDPYGSNIMLGFEAIGLGGDSYFGSRFFSRMDIAASDRFTISPIIEVTDMPHAENFGVRLLGEAAFDIGMGFSLAARGGYQARESASGGVGIGGHVSLAF